MVDLTPEQLKEKYDPQPLQVVESERQMVGAKFSPCGKSMVSGGYDGLLHRWDLTQEKIVTQEPITGHHGWLQGCDFHPSQPRVFSGDSWGRLACHDYLQPAPEPVWAVKTAHDGWLRDLAVSPDGNLVASCGRDQQARLWTTADGQKIHQAFNHQHDVYRVGFHPDGQYLVSADAHGMIRKWDVKTGEAAGEFNAGELFSVVRLQDVGGVHAMTFSPDGTLLLAGGTRPKNGGNVQGTPLVLVFDWKTMKQIQALEMGPTSDVYVQDLQFHPGGFLMVATSGNPGAGKLHFQRLEDEKPFYTSSGFSNCHAISVHADGERLAITMTSKGSNGNGRPLDKDGNYLGNSSPIHLLGRPQEEEENS